MIPKYDVVSLPPLPVNKLRQDAEMQGEALWITFINDLFHEFGHWIFREGMEREMTLEPNNSIIQNSNFKEASLTLW